VRRAGRSAAVFLDRDGVVNENVDGDYVRDWDGFRFFPGALDAIARLTRAGWPIVIVTNQQGVGKGLMRAADVDAIHARMLAEIRAAGGDVAAVRYCPHLASDGCACRKPKAGLLIDAAADFGFDLARSVFVGDAESDVHAARAAGCRAVLVRTGRGQAAVAALSARGGLDEVLVAADLPAAVELLLGGGAD
jgi:D-glycero-D-manno-heptose 1,7-bisphosphate phosphatase